MSFDPHYFPLQTIDCNYQTPPSATASSSAYVPISKNAEEVRLICCSTAVCLCHFGSALPITVVEKLMVRCHHFAIMLEGGCCQVFTNTA